MESVTPGGFDGGMPGGLMSGFPGGSVPGIVGGAAGVPQLLPQRALNSVLGRAMNQATRPSSASRQMTGNGGGSQSGRPQSGSQQQQQQPSAWGGLVGRSLAAMGGRNPEYGQVPGEDREDSHGGGFTGGGTNTAAGVAAPQTSAAATAGFLGRYAALPQQIVTAAPGLGSINAETGEPLALKPYQIYKLYADGDEGLKYEGFCRLLDHLEIQLNSERHHMACPAALCLTLLCCPLPYLALLPSALPCSAALCLTTLLCPVLSDLP